MESSGGFWITLPPTPWWGQLRCRWFWNQTATFDKRGIVKSTPKKYRMIKMIYSLFEPRTFFWRIANETNDMFMVQWCNIPIAINICPLRKTLPHRSSYLGSSRTSPGLWRGAETQAWIKTQLRYIWSGHISLGLCLTAFHVKFRSYIYIGLQNQTFTTSQGRNQIPIHKSEKTNPHRNYNESTVCFQVVGEFYSQIFPYISYIFSPIHCQS